MGETGDVLTLVGVMNAGIGVVLILAGIAWILRNRSFMEGASDARGRVTGFEEHRNIDSGSHTYSAYVEFMGPTGSPVTFRDPTATNPPGFEVGEEVPVKYDRNDPSKARIAKGARMNLFPAILIAAGLLFASIGGVMAAVA